MPFSLRTSSRGLAAPKILDREAVPATGAFTLRLAKLSRLYCLGGAAPSAAGIAGAGAGAGAAPVVSAAGGWLMVQDKKS